MKGMPGAGSHEEGATLIEVMIAVAIMAIVSVVIGLEVRSKPAIALDEGLLALEVLRTEMALIKSGTLGPPEDLDGAGFSGIRRMHLLPLVESRIRVTPLKTAGVCRVVLEISWKGDNRERQKVKLAALVEAHKQ